jgi:hypothetical protein
MELELLLLELDLLVINLLPLPLLPKLLTLLMKYIRSDGGGDIFPREFRHVCTADTAALRCTKYASVHFSNVIIMNHNVTCRGIVNLEAFIAIPSRSHLLYVILIMQDQSRNHKTKNNVTLSRKTVILLGKLHISDSPRDTSSRPLHICSAGGTGTSAISTAAPL